MKCKYPLVLSKNRIVACGQCHSCRFNKRRLWTHRIQLEAMLHSHNTFATLTYDNDHLPPGECLQKRELQLFLMRLRKKIGRFRYYAVGEYGDETQRPHYHLAIFGVPNCLYGKTRPRKSCCKNCDTIGSTWGKGNVFLGELTRESAQYIGGYVVKKMNNPDDERLEGRTPEFATMSNKPGLGYGVVDEIAQQCLKYNVKYVPDSLTHGGKSYPLGTYLRDKIAEKTGLPKAPPYQDPKVLELSEKIFQVPKSNPSQDKYLDLSHAIWKQNRFRIEGNERRYRSKNRRKKL